MHASLAPENVAATIGYIKDDADSRKVPVLWWVGPSSRPLDLAEQLIQLGFSLEDDSPGMAVELAKLNNNLPKPERFSIRRVRADIPLRE